MGEGGRKGEGGERERERERKRERSCIPVPTEIEGIVITTIPLMYLLVAVIKF